MHGINAQVIQTVCAWLDQGDKVWFVTIVETWGASPRPIGSIFAFNPGKDLMVGSLSGGCIEEDLLEQLKTCEHSTPFIQRYGDSPEEQQRFMLPCGGAIELVIEPIEPSESQRQNFMQIQQCLDERKRVVRTLSLTNGDVSLSAVGEETTSVTIENRHVTLVLGPQYHLLIVGAGEICRYLIPLAQSLEFSVTMCDPRETMLSRFPIEEEGVSVAEGLPDDVVRDQFSDQYSAIVALSHDPRVDDLAIMAGLETKAFYVGAMGSARTSSNRKARLESLGIPAEKLESLHAPIGLDIGSKTPPEIAISIAAELIQKRKITSTYKA